MFQIIEKMKIIPLDKNDIERCVSNFHSYADEIRTNIPELLLATMESLYMKYVKVKSAYPSGLSSGDAGNVDLVSIQREHIFLIYLGSVTFKFHNF